MSSPPRMLIRVAGLQVQHVVQLDQLRPAWKWDEKSRQWSKLDKLPPPKEKGSAPRSAPKAKKQKL